MILNVNDRVEAEWVQDTSPTERVRQAVARAYEPRTVTDIAKAARISPETAHEHLRRLKENGFVERISSPDRSETLYQRSPESLVLEQTRNIRAEMGPDQLAARVDEMQDEIREYQEQYGTESPEDAASQEVRIDAETLQEWRTMRRNLSFAKVAHELNDAVEIIEEIYDGRPSRQ